MRRTQRIAVDIPILWTRGGRSIACHARDINAHGMFMVTDENVEPGALMHVELKLHEHMVDMYVTARFVGRTASGQGVGVEIFLIDDVAQCRWMAFYEELVATEALRRQTAAATATR